jgi:hypothetical protein
VFAFIAAQFIGMAMAVVTGTWLWISSDDRPRLP